jgi:very-short-patch-repair endonuclease
MNSSINISLTIDELNELISLTYGELKYKLKSKLPKIKIKGQSTLNKGMLEVASRFRKDLIKNQTKSEGVFKAKLKSLKINYEFQKIIYDNDKFYIVDFYLPDSNIVVEIDGGYHNTKDQIYKDKLRSSRLSILGYKKIKRFTNEEAINIKDFKIKETLL